MDMYSLVLFAVFVVFAFLTARIAERSGRSVKMWTGLAVVFGPLAWLVVLLLPTRRRVV
jgi:hypothetical protein